MYVYMCVQTFWDTVLLVNCIPADTLPRLLHPQNPLAPLPAGPPAIKTTSDPGAGAAADASGPAGGPDQTPSGVPSGDSPTPTPTGGLVSAGDPLVSPTRFSANKGGGRRGARGLRR